ncbi:hypothetical protein Btru_004962 [Bulinus truncatus]|nr:hypothetical protein Btru_004962 [Bulinus truncatus]
MSKEMEEVLKRSTGLNVGDNAEHRVGRSFGRNVGRNIENSVGHGAGVIARLSLGPNCRVELSIVQCWTQQWTLFWT